MASENVAINCLCYRILIIGSEWVNKKTQDFAYQKERIFQPEFIPKGSINMVKVLSSSCEQCFGPFTMLLVKVSFETGFVRHLSKHVFWSLSAQKCMSDEGHRSAENVQS